MLSKKDKKAGERLMLLPGIGLGMVLAAVVFSVVFGFTEDRVQLLCWGSGILCTAAVASIIW